MATATTYIQIRSGIAAYLTANLDWATEDGTFDYFPTDAATVFGSLPAVVVDFDRNEAVRWTPVEEGYLKGVPVLIEIYVHKEKPDASGGRDASELIANYLDDVENLFKQTPSIGQLVKTSEILNSKVETLILEATNLGLLSRWAWVSIIAYIVA